MRRMPKKKESLALPMAMKECWFTIWSPSRKMVQKKSRVSRAERSVRAGSSLKMAHRGPGKSSKQAHISVAQVMEKTRAHRTVSRSRG